MRKQIGLVQDHELRSREHVGVLERLVFALGDREDGDLGRFAQVPHRGADQVAHVLDEEQAVRVVMVVIVLMVMPVIVVVMAVQLRKGFAHHRRIQVAALAGVDLDRGCTGGADAVSVEAGLLVAFDHGHVQARRMGLERFDGGAQQRGLARSRAGHEVERGHAVGFKVGPVLLRHAVVGAEDVGLQLDGARLAHARHRDAGRTRAEMQVAVAGVHLHHAGFAHVGLDMPGMGRAVVTASAYDTHIGSPLLCSSKHRPKEGQLPSRTAEPALPGRRSGPPPAKGERGGRRGAGGASYQSSLTLMSITRNSMPPVGCSW
ncbi:hypothetical protein D9M69_458940 [compost metagenome]